MNSAVLARNIKYCYTLFLLVCLVLAGCRERERTDHVQMSPMTEVEARTSVNNYASEKNIDLEALEEPYVIFDSKLDRWHFMFNPKNPSYIGDHFSILVYTDGRVQYVGGR